MRKLLYITLSLGVIIVAYYGFFWWNDPARLIRNNSSDFHEFMSDVSFTGDFTRCIKAKTTHEFFEKFAHKIGISNKITSLPEGTPVWTALSDDWWNPPDDYNGVYFEAGESGSRRFLAYRNGYLYYDICVW